MIEIDRERHIPASHRTPVARFGKGRLKPDSLGLLDVVFMAVATAAPITAMSGNVPFSVGYGVGTATPATYVLVTVILSIFGVAYVAMTRHVTSVGAFYGFVSRGLGRVPGLGAGYMVTFSYSVFEAALIGIFSYFAQQVFHDQLGLDVPWLIFALVCAATNSTLAYFDIGLTAKILAFFLITEVGMLVAMAVSVLLHGGGPDGLMPSTLNPLQLFGFNGLEMAAPGLAFFIAFWSWTGFESTAIYGEESRHPRKVIPVATAIAVVGVGLLYIFVSWMAIAGNGATASVALAQGPQPLDVLLRPTAQFLGPWAVLVFQWTLISGAFACGMAFHNCAARYLYALGRERLLPGYLARTHHRYGSPYAASFAQTAMAVAWVLGFWVFRKDPYLDVWILLAVVGTFSLLIVQVLTMAGVFNYFRTHPGMEGFWTSKVCPLLGATAMVGALILMIQNFGAAPGPASTTLLFRLVPYISVVLFVIGAIFALYLKRADPAKYQTIGRVALASQTRIPSTDVDTDSFNVEWAFLHKP